MKLPAGDGVAAALGSLLFVPVSLLGAELAERIVDRVSQKRLRMLIAGFLRRVGLERLLFLSIGEPQRATGVGPCHQPS